MNWHIVLHDRVSNFDIQLFLRALSQNEHNNKSNATFLNSGNVTTKKSNTTTSLKIWMLQRIEKMTEIPPELEDDPHNTAIQSILEFINDLKDDEMEMDRKLRQQRIDLNLEEEEEEDGKQHDDSLRSHCDDDEDAKHLKQVQRSYNFMTKEIAVLNRSDIVGLPDKEEFQFFYAVASLEDDVSVLRTMVKSSSEAFEELAKKLDEEQFVVQKMEECKGKLEKELSDLKERVEETKEPEVKKSKCTPQIDQQIRTTKKVYKDMKSIFGAVLEKVSKIEKEQKGKDSLLGDLLQKLWLIHSSEGSEVYLSLNDISFDPLDVVWLMDNLIIEKNPENAKEIRLIDFLNEENETDEVLRH